MLERLLAEVRQRRTQAAEQETHQSASSVPDHDRRTAGEQLQLQSVPAIA
ncbi:MAG: hypothetical protein R3E45_04370 [Rhodocyclaceae bacterium]